MEKTRKDRIRPGVPPGSFSRTVPLAAWTRTLSQCPLRLEGPAGRGDGYSIADPWYRGLRLLRPADDGHRRLRQGTEMTGQPYADLRDFIDRVETLGALRR